MNLARHLAHRAAERPDAPALVDGRGDARRTLTFGALDARVAATARRLHARGLGVGARVLVAVPPRLDAFVLLGGLLRAGVAAVVPDATRGVRGLAQALRRVPPDAIVLPDGLARLLPRRLGRMAVHGLAALTAPGDETDAARPAARPDFGPDLRPDFGPDLPPETVALVTFTSGSTGRPRVVARSHAVLGAQFDAVQRLLGTRPGDVDLATLPVFALASLAAGGTVVLPGQPVRRVSRLDARALLNRMRAEGVTRLVASPALLTRLVAATDDAGGDRSARAALAALRHIHTGGGPVRPSLVEALRAAAPEADIVAVYGSTEAEPIAATDAPETHGAGLLAGPPVPGTRLALVRPDVPSGPLTAEAWAACAVARGDVGEVAVAGPHVVPAYLDGEGDAEAKREVDGVRWHLTGDLGRLDSGGRLWLVGRAAAHVPGAPLPFEVDALAGAVPGVRRAALVPLDGRAIVAVEGPQADLDAVRRAVGARIDAVVRVRAVPLDRRHDAKVDLPALARIVRRALRSSVATGAATGAARDRGRSGDRIRGKDGDDGETFA